MEIRLFDEKLGYQNLLIDDDDYEKIKNYQVKIAYRSRNTRIIYVDIIIGGKYEPLHRYLMEVNGHDITGFYIDHINHDGLDNRKENLRICTNAENCRNSRKQLTPTSSKYKGVSWNKRIEKWEVNIKYNFKKVSLGFTDDETTGGKMYDQAAVYFFGEFADLNFPNEQIEEILNMKNVEYKHSTDKKERTTSKYYGLYWHKLGYWHASIIVNGKKISLKYHKDETEGAMAVDEYIINNNLENYYYKLNFPEKYKHIIGDNK